MEKTYHVYILSSRSRLLYTGVTDELIRRIAEHRDGSASAFTAKYRIHRLVYCEAYGNIKAAIAREKQIKSWRREKRITLIESSNPTWVDLAADWFPPYPRKAGPSASLGMTISGNAPRSAGRIGAAKMPALARLEPCADAEIYAET